MVALPVRLVVVLAGDVRRLAWIVRVGQDPAEILELGHVTDVHMAMRMPSSLGSGLPIRWAQSSQAAWPAPLPDLNTIEECQKADLGRYWGETFRFHRDGCWANVTFDERGKVTALEPDDAAICEQVLAGCGWHRS